MLHITRYLVTYELIGIIWGSIDTFILAGGIKLTMTAATLCHIDNNDCYIQGYYNAQKYSALLVQILQSRSNRFYILL